MQNNLQSHVENHERSLVYFHTPMCGTCALAETYLDIASEMDSVPPLLKVDINFSPQTAEKWKIESVPCLVLIDNNRLEQKMYAFENVLKIYNFARGERV
ncbi:thioredoxin family protein [Alkalicoccus saliphilus]|uniref:Thiol reductase thioredoxin n=1 Tax=Alkalicoccus saliphilus TaxID=200989 RepID=A0A2T4UA46_9BACI|nr:thioredoxin family protein [Alkalicoccus saliphilus]PTL40275.1 thiol reductase thioredoxin [Alkalicoccus saliphilus]